MPNEALLTHLLAETYARYERTSMKGRNKYGVPGFHFCEIVTRRNADISYLRRFSRMV